MYPVFINLSGKLCVVIGGGQVAERKVKRLLQSGAEVLLISPEISKGLRKLIKKNNKIRYIRKKFEGGIIPHNSFMVFECVGDKELVKHIRSICSERKILLNSATCPEFSDFFVPALIKKGDVSIAISTEGKVSAFSKALREKIGRIVTPSVIKKLKVIEKIREELMKIGKKTENENKFLLEISRIAIKENSSLRDFVRQVLKKSKRYKVGLNFKYVWNRVAGAPCDIHSDSNFRGTKETPSDS